MADRKAEPAIDTRTLHTLLEEVKDAHTHLGAELKKLERSAPLSEAYYDSLSEIYTQLTLWECLARDLKAEMDRLDDQLPED